MDILFFAFANDRDNPLPSLEAEDEFIYSLLAPRQAQSHFVIHRDQSVSIEKLAEYLTLYRHNIVLFHYSGHAGKEHLSLDDEQASAYGIAEMLGNCPRLKAVILNGCSTAGQVTRLLEKQVPLVIATSSSVEDEKAKEFAIQFYRSLSNQETITQAFEAARGKVLTIQASVPFVRDTLSVGAPDEPVWGIFQTADLIEAQEWSLPLGSSNTTGAVMAVNELLLETLVSALSIYSPEVKKVWDKLALGGTVKMTEKREAVLKCLPHPVSEQVRKLLVTEAGGSGALFFDRAGLPRLSQMITVYDTIIELMGFIMLAQLWESLFHKRELKIDHEVTTQVKKFLTQSPAGREENNYIPIIKVIRKFLNDNQIQYFVDELQFLSDIFKEGEPFFEACQFLDSIKGRIRKDEIGATDAINLCILVEDELAKVLSELGFIARYTFSSVKSIDVAKYRHSKEVQYKHNVVHLIQSLVGLEEEVEIMTEYMDTASILLIKSAGEKKEFLTLSPFIIDDNAFDDKASLAKLYYFDRYIRDKDMYMYRHVYKPLDPQLPITNQVQYRVVKAQFEAFAQLLFNHPMRQVL